MVAYTSAAFILVICSFSVEGHWEDGSGRYFSPARYINKIFEEGHCYDKIGWEPCADIRNCSRATASLALGGMPNVCGWVGKGVPKVCCGYSLVKGPLLHKKIEAEKARRRECGTRKFSPGLSPTEKIFERIAKSIPAVDVTDPNKFDPPLAETSEDEFVLGGEPAKQGEFPWMVSIRKYDEHWCGGSLIDRVHILTAAHCFDDDRDPSIYMVHVGDIIADEGYPIKLSKIVMHPEYSNEYHYHDLAILTLAEEILVPQLAHICLPDPVMVDLAGQNTSLLGWGATSYDGWAVPKLQVVDDLPVVPWQECRKKYQKLDVYTLPFGITEDFICAGLREGGKDACQQDSGGPLMYQQKLNASKKEDIPWILVGVVSFGFRCGQPGYPGVYVRVANYIPWIMENMQQR